MSDLKKQHSGSQGPQQGSLFDTREQGGRMAKRVPKTVEIKTFVFPDFPEGAIRTTPDKRVSVYDAIRVATGAKNPHQVWNDLKKTYPEVLQKTESYKFPGRGQLPTPVTNKEGFIRILVFLPGEEAKRFRDIAVPVIVRYLEADATLAEEIIDRQTDPEVLHRLALRAKSKEVRSILTGTIKSHGGISENGYSRNTYAQVTHNVQYPVLRHKASEVQAYTGQRLTRDGIPSLHLTMIMMSEQLYAHGVETKQLYGHQQLVEESKI